MMERYDGVQQLPLVDKEKLKLFIDMIGWSMVKQSLNTYIKMNCNLESLFFIEKMREMARTVGWHEWETLDP